MSTILVIGASQGIGLETIKAGLAGGHTMRALARRAGDIAIADPRLQKISGSALEASDVERAVIGADAVVMTLGSSKFFEKTTLFSSATSIVIGAMRKTGVRRLIVITGIGAGDSRGHGGFFYDNLLQPILLKRIYADKDVQEMQVRKSGLDWTIVRPGVLNNNPATGKYRALPDAKDWGPGTVSRADVAAYVIDEIVNPRHIGKTPLLLD